MKKVGEINLSRVHNQHRTIEQLKNGRILNKRTVLTKCSTCEHNELLSERVINKLSRQGKAYKCNQCKIKENEELKRAIINLAIRKNR